MHQTGKRLLVGLLTVGTMLFSLPSMNTEAAQEMWLDGEQDGFQYTINLNYGYGIITGCDVDKTGVVKVPDKVLTAPVKVIGTGAFCGCGYTDEELAEMGWEHSCSGCGITELILPDSVTTIQQGAFQNCESLKAIHFPAGLENFNGDASQLNEYVLESGSYGYASWTEGCTQLERLTISENNPYFKSVNGIIYSKDGTSIGPVLYGIDYDSVDFSGITRIGDYAFCGHSEITELNLPPRITSVGAHAFQGCNNLDSVYIPSGVGSVGDYAFAGIGRDRYDETVLDYYAVQILLSEGLHDVGEYAFSSIDGLRLINLPDSLKDLGKGAFAFDVRLKSMCLPSGIQVIPDRLCEDCMNLQRISLPAGVTAIGDYAFRSGGKLTTVSLPSGLKSIGQGAFSCRIDYSCDTTFGLHSVSIPDSVEYIGPSAFEGNINLAYVKLPDNENGTVIGESAFTGCQLTNLYIPGNIQSISDDAFGCKTKHLTIGEGLTEIGDRAFNGLPNLERLTLPESLKTIGANAFAEMGSNACFWDGSKYISISIPDGVTEIGYGAFAGSSLRDIRLPDSLETVGFQAFDGSALEVLEYPEGIVSLNEWYTMGCEDLRAIYLPDTLRSIEPIAIAKKADLVLVVLSAGELTIELGDWSIRNLELVPDIYFAGTEQEWNALTKNWDFSAYGTDASVMDSVTVHFNAKRQSSLMGDVNADGQFTVADMVLLQKWLIGKGILHSPENGDMNVDGVLNGWDLICMRRSLIEMQPVKPVFRADISAITWDAEAKKLLADVNYENLPAGSDAWIGVVPAGTGHSEVDADSADLVVSYISAFESGEFPGFSLPSAASGSYELRIYSSDSGGTELAAAGFEIP